MKAFYLVGNIGGDDIDVVYLTDYLTPKSYKLFFDKIREFYGEKKFIPKYGPIIDEYPKKVGHVCMLSKDMHIAELPLSQWIKEQKVLWGNITLDSLFGVPEITPRKVLWGSYGLNSMYQWLKNRYVINYRQLIFKNRFVQDVVYSYKRITYANTKPRLFNLIKYVVKFSIINMHKINEQNTESLEKIYEELMRKRTEIEYGELQNIWRNVIKIIKNHIERISKEHLSPPPKIKYKKIKEEDVEKVVNFYNVRFSHYKMIPRIKPVDKEEEKIWKKRIKGGATIGYIAYDVSRDSGELIGACTVVKFPKNINNIKTYRVSVSMDPFYLNRGFGAPLINRTIKEARGVLISDTHINNFPMHSVMRKSGFRNITYLKNQPLYHAMLVKNFQKIYGEFNNKVYHLWELRR